ncbi:MAG TPA: glycoside hydrolase family 57 protein [Nitrospirales bacterium]
MKTVAVAFLWHLHQPYYTDPLTNTAPFPWVRLHATKGYFDMGMLLDEYPEMQATVNLTPSLLLQLQEQEQGRVRDIFLSHAACVAADLSEEARAFILRHFFAANWDTMVRPHERYYSLLIQRGRRIEDVDLGRAATRFSTQDFLDLQVWHNLAWFGHRALARYPTLRELIAKGRQFTEAEKQEVLSIQHDVVGQLIPLFKRLADREQIELSTTPFFHPILPLLINTEFAKRSRPDAALPPSFAHPEDARAQLRDAVEFHTALFGHRPAGLWPSEGSVCPELIPMAAELGFRWTATDEGILAASVEAWNRERMLYRPYVVSFEGREVACLFRDREISDAMGFVYARNDPRSAVQDFMARLATVAERSPEERPLVPVILDGENPWEHYADGGESFLRTLYSTMAGAQGAIRFHTVTPDRELARHSPTARLNQLHTGSWINADFRIWIGHPEDNDAWERLGRTRRFLERQEQEGLIAVEAIEAARKELYAAEGSDWFWWYGDDFVTDHKEVFDQLFRLHLGNVFRTLNTDVPEFLLQPIWRREIVEAMVHEPVALIDPCIDGIVTDFYEWRGAGYIDGQPPLSAMYKRPGLFRRIYFGFNLEYFFLRFDLQAVQSSEETPPCDNGPLDLDQVMAAPVVHVQFLEPHHVKLVFSLEPSEPECFTLLKSSDGISFFSAAMYESIRRKKIIELKVPLKDMGVQLGSMVHLVIKVSDAGLERERLPPYHPLTLRVPDVTFEATMWKA